MKLLLTTNGRLYKDNKGRYFTPIVYGYHFFEKYISYFKEIRLLAHVETVDDEFTKGMIRVDGKGIEVFEVYFPHGKIDYIKNYFKIGKQIESSISGCDVAIFRIPDQLAFQAIGKAKKSGLPLGVEVNSNSWEFFGKGFYTSPFRPILRLLWDVQQKWACRLAHATAYVTKEAIQKRYPPHPDAINGKNPLYFTTYYSDVDIESLMDLPSRIYDDNIKKNMTWLHISGSISGRAKGHYELLQAASIMKKQGVNVHLILVGGGKLDDACQAIIDIETLSVEFMGQLDADEIKQCFLRSDVFVFPSYREGLPRVVVEAMAAGLVCVTTDLPGIKELLDEKVLVPIKNSVALAEKLYTLSQNPQQMTEQSARNKENSLNYSQKVLKERRNQFYSHLAKLRSNHL